MNIKQAREEIKDTVEAYLLKDERGRYVLPAVRQRPVLLIGPPGVGKTQIMEQAARECKIGLVAYTITHHTRQSAIGLPYITEKTYGGRTYSATEYTMSEIVASVYDKIKETGIREGILFIDEINCVSETLAPAMLQFLQYKTFGNHRIPEGWIIVAAGNPPEYNKSVRDFDVATLDRLKPIHVEADYGVWKEYAYQESVHPAVLSYLNIKRENFCRIETTVDGKRFATPRGWEDLSRLMQVYERLEKRVDRGVISQYIQFPAIARDFANYLELYYKYQSDYQVEEILKGVIRESLCDRVARAPFDEKLSVTGLLLSGLNRTFREIALLGKKLEMERELLIKLGEEPEGKEDVEKRLKEQISALGRERERLRQAGLLSRDEESACLEAQEELTGFLKELETQAGSGNLSSWERLKALFEKRGEAYGEEIERGGRELEHAFDFMEASFGEGQEMVIFITELNTGVYSVGFLREYECERYYRYNRSLLFRDREGDITKRLENLGI